MPFQALSSTRGDVPSRLFSELDATYDVPESDSERDSSGVSGFVEARHFGCFDALSRISADELI